MSTRLDVIALVALIGKGKIREELDKNVWYYNIIYNVDDNCPILKYVDIPENIPPFEYLFFNDPQFLEWILSSTPGRYHHGLIDDLHIFFTSKNISDECLKELWSRYSVMTLRKLNDIFLNG